VRFKQIIISDFGVFSGEQPFDLKPSTERSKPVILVGGMNGAGKTTFLEAFKICLYGNSYRGHKIPKKVYNKHLRSRLHRTPDGKRATSASITLEFDFAKLGYIDSYIVKRSWIDTEQGIKETLFVQENGQTLTQVNEEQWQNFLMELIPPSLSNLFFFDGEKIRSLARGKALNRHIIESINSLLGLDLIEQLRYDMALYRSKEMIPDERKDFQTLLTKNRAEKQAIEEKLETARQNNASLENRVARIGKEIDEQELKISAEGGGFAAQRENLKEKSKELETRIDLKKDEIRELCAGLLPFACVPELCKNLKDRLQSEEQDQQMQATLNYLNFVAADLTKEIERSLTIEKSKLSVTDKQLVATEAVSILRRKIESMHNVSKEPLHAVSKSERQELLNWIESTFSQVPKKLRVISLDLQLLKSEYETVHHYLFSAPADEVIKPLVLKLGLLYEELGKVKEQQLGLEKEIKLMEQTLELTMHEYEKLIDTQRVCEKSDRRVELAARTQDVIEEYLQSLRNTKVNEFKDNFLECFNLLFSKNDLIRSVAVDEKSFDVTLMTTRGVVIPKSEFSEGERQIYAMAMIWALAKTSGRTLPFIIDTPLSRLDTNHKDNLVNNFFIDASHQMIIFSTNTEVDQHYYNQLKCHVAKEYYLEYNSEKSVTTVKSGYFWRAN